MTDLWELSTWTRPLSTQLRIVVDVTESPRSASDVIAARLKEVRKGRGINVPRLADLCAGVGAPNLTESVIMNIESGRPDAEGRRRRDITVNELLDLARALGVSPLVLLLPAQDVAYPLTPAETASASVVFEWIVGERLPPLPAPDQDDEWTDENRAVAWHLFSRALTYVPESSTHWLVRAELERLRDGEQRNPLVIEDLRQEFAAEIETLKRQQAEMGIFFADMKRVAQLTGDSDSELRNTVKRLLGLTEDRGGDHGQSED